MAAAKKAAKSKAPVEVAAKAAPSPSERLEAIGIEAICVEIANGQSLRAWALGNGFVQQTVLDWINSEPARAGHYARAREDRADAVFDSLDDVSEQAVVAGNAVEVAGLRLKSDNIKWKLARMNAKKYGDKVGVEHSGGLTIDKLPDDVLEDRMKELMLRMQKP